VGTDGSGGRASDSPRLTASPIGRVYGRRRGRPLKGKKAALLGSSLDTLAIRLPEPPGLLDPLSLFAPAKREVWLEIGFGGGEHLAAQAAAHPEIGFIGCEPFINGVSSLLVLLDAGAIQNVRVLSDDARLLLQALPGASVARAFLLFPDPWPKRRHENRRFVTPEGLDLLARALSDDAEFRVATDHALLGEWMQAQIGDHPALHLMDRAGERPPGWASTRYEAKAIAAGRRPVYLTYRRNRRENTPDSRLEA
jgi:tRNA (guanine-N7-)-methyltransferase